MGTRVALHLPPPHQAAYHGGGLTPPHRSQSAGDARRAQLRAHGDAPGRRGADHDGGGAGMLIFTLAGRGVMLLDGDRIEVAANDLVHIPAGVSYGLQTLGGTDWTYVVLQAPVE